MRTRSEMLKALCLVVWAFTAPFTKAVPAVAAVLFLILAAPTIRRAPWWKNGYIAAFGLLAIWRFISAGLCGDPLQGLRGARFVILLPAFLFLALPGEETRKTRIRVAMALLTGASIVAALFFVDWLTDPNAPLPFLSRSPDRGGGVMTGFYPHHNQAGALMGLAFILGALSFSSAPLGRGKRAILSLATLLVGGGFLFSYSRSLYIGMAFALISAALLVGGRFRIVPFLLAAAGGVSLLLVEKMRRVVGALLLHPFTESSFMDRASYWEDASRVIHEHPILGVGYHNLENVAVTGNPHSIYLDAWAETGIVGIILLVMAWLLFTRIFIRGARAAGVGTWDKTLAAAAASSLVFLLVGDCFERNLTIEYILFPLTMVLAAGAFRPPA